jgi:hypothetical protein
VVAAGATDGHGYDGSATPWSLDLVTAVPSIDGQRALGQHPVAVDLAPASSRGETQTADVRALVNSRRRPDVPGVEPAFQPTAVDVKRLENLEDLVHRQLILERPNDNVEVLAAMPQVLDDRVDDRRSLEVPYQKPEIASVELDPEGLTSEMLNPAMSKKLGPVPHNPRSDGGIAEITPGFFAFDPLVPVCLFRAPLVKTRPPVELRFGERTRTTTLDHRVLHAETRTIPLVHRKDLSGSIVASARADFHIGMHDLYANHGIRGMGVNQ